MDKGILIQHAHPDTDDNYQEMLQLTHNRHQAYCLAHGLDFWSEVYNDARYPAITGAWLKIQLILRAIDQGFTDIIYLDADTLIWSLDENIRDGIPPSGIGACWHRIPQLHHWNVGALYIEAREDVKRFLQEWLGSYPAPPDGWNEQGVFNRMGRASALVSTISDRWNATINVNMCPDAVVLGYHGQGNGEQRLSMMRQTLNL